MSTPKLTEVFLIEAPTDWKKSFSSVKKADRKAGSPLQMGYGQHEIPKGPKKPAKPTKIRAGGPDNDPLKDSTSAEHFATEAGDYIMFRGINQKYYVRFISGDVKKVRDLGDHASRSDAIDTILSDHDKNAAGIGEEVEEDVEE